MYRYLENRLAQQIRGFLQENYAVQLERIVIEQPPKVEFGEYALPLAFELAKKLRKAPRKIAEEIVAGIGTVAGFQKLEVAGAGYINARVDRGALATALVGDQSPPVAKPSGKILVEHSSINPNKAAHIGHLRNAILGDTFVRLLRYAGRTVDVQNYIDNTGVQVADVVVGFLHLERKSRAEIEQLADRARFDYYCWDLYARVSQWYEQNPENKKVRLQALHEIEQGGNETSAIAELLSTAVLGRHLETMDRLEIEYDFLPRESEILHLHFWEAAFEKLKAAGVLFYEEQGKNRGCWVMRRAGLGKAAAKASTTGDAASGDGGPEKDNEASEDDQKVIVRSNGTVGYVGKDIAYHMWKFGLLGKDFGYRKFYHYPVTRRDCWISATDGEKNHPHFGGVAEIYNVIDARQSEAQNAVIEALRGLGYHEAADHYTHFSYEMVALTPGCAAELGYALSEGDKARPYVEVSGRKGFGVKADDLLDTLIATAAQEVDARNRDLTPAQRDLIAKQIAIGALRYFMLKYTKPAVIAFDFKEALSFEGETGPYAQYAVVRATNIFRKGGLDANAFLTEVAGKIPGSELTKFLTGENSNELWELWLAASKTAFLVDQCIAATEPAYLAKHVFQLAQMFNTFYHRYPILSEADEQRKRFLLTTVAVVRRELIRTLGVLGIDVPAAM